MFSYDFKSKSKEWVPEDKQLLQKKRARNFLVFILYLTAFGIFLLLNSFTAHLLDVIVITITSKRWAVKLLSNKKIPKAVK